MPDLLNHLELDSCPHCSRAKPLLSSQHRLETRDHSGLIHRKWHIYQCSHCGGLVTAWGMQFGETVFAYYPENQTVADELPERAKNYLQQAVDSLHAPSGAVILSASSVDAMLKAKGYTDGSLYSRIDKAVADNLITPEMAEWAHEIRLDANDERHADEDSKLPNSQDGQRCIDFAKALGEFLFVLPARITTGIKGDAGNGDD